MQMTRITIVRKVAAIAAALVALTVAFVAGIGSAATATQGEAVIAGFGNAATSTTGITNGNFGEAFAATTYTGNPSSAILGQAFSGGNGVFGLSDSNTASGVYGQNDGSGFGVAGRAIDGTGVLADSANGTALSVSGKAQFSRSGLVTITYPATSKVVSGVSLTAKSLVIATNQKYVAGVYVVAAVPKLSGSSNSFTIYLSKAPGTSAAPKSVTVAWQAIEHP
jgi:hypothetical protein